MRSKIPKIAITMSEAESSAKLRWPLRKGFDYIKHEYFESILRAGGFPVLIPNIRNEKTINSFFDSVDGILITGGVDIHPRYFGQKPHSKLSRTTRARDYLEMKVIQIALKKNIPLLAICRGHQILNVAMGGTLYQDLSCIKQKTLIHSDQGQTGVNFHRANIEKKSLLYKIIGAQNIKVSSSHHQVIDKLGRGLKSTAFAPDGLIEAIEFPENDFTIGVQWHPEVTPKMMHSKKLFRYFIKASGQSK